MKIVGSIPYLYDLKEIMSIQVTGISKSFGRQRALKEVSFQISKGEIVGFLGPNGAGKSTMMRILTTYLEADSGRAAVNEFDVQTDARNVQRSVGYLPENNPLYPEMYAREYLAYQADFFNVEQTTIESVIERTGLKPEVHKKIGQLSKGYRQRVGLAAALLHDPDVLILDEPTTGLDPNQLIEIRKLIREIGAHKTILFSTHILKEVEAVCDRVIIINYGEIVADESLEALRAKQEQLIEVEFDYRVEEVLLQRLPHVNTVRNLQGFVYEISFATERDMRPVLFDFAHDNELKTLQLSRKNISLEQLFAELTS